MNKNFIKLLSICFVCMMFFASCEKYPIDALLGIHEPIGDWPDIWYLYDDQFNTKGSFDPFLFEYYPWGDRNPYCDNWNHVVLDFKCGEHPQSGSKCIKFSWIGNSKDTSDIKKTFISFGMQSRVKQGDTIDLTKSEYKYLKFYIKGFLYDNCIFEINIPNKEEPDAPWIKYETTKSGITSVWQEVEIEIQKEILEQMSELEYNLAFALKTNGITNGGTVYIDNIRLTKD